MASYTHCLFFFLITCIVFSHSTSNEDRKSYIVYMGSLPNEADYSPSSHHLNILQNVLSGSISAENSIIRSYSNSFNGFAAKLTEIEKQKLSSLEEVVSVFPDEIQKVQTTRSWDFMGFRENVKRNKIIESDIIIGLLDTGVWPESESFNDKGFGPIPKKWKGQCPRSFPCNNLLGLELSCSHGTDAPRDYIGHGTHTASIAAGNVVPSANFYGVAQGSARGGVPSSRIAEYQVCSENGCLDSDLLAGFDIAIKDGVDIISASISINYCREFYEDSIAIGAFHAMEKGILTIQAAGNNGNEYMSYTSSLAPWVFSIAAGSIDRHIVSNLVLGNGQTLAGNSINSYTLAQKNYPLVYGKDATSKCSAEEGSFCAGECLDRKLVSGKILMCDNPYGAVEAARIGAAGVIIMSQMENVSFMSPLTTSSLDPYGFSLVKSYYEASNGSSVGYIHKTEAINDPIAPVVAVFSSRGPNQIASDILKPDLTAPGIDILAAFSPMTRLTTSPYDKRSVNYSIISGTSMATPHVAGASAYVKSFHPTWSPSAIKSALMTTAWVMSDAKNVEVEFAYGSGHIDPVKAVKPGLVYESDINDYTNFLCKLGYNATKIKLITSREASCTNNATSKSTPTDLNYPSMTAKISSNASYFRTEFHRTVTNVGSANSTYKVVVAAGSNMEVKVEPSSLSLVSMNERKSFKVSVGIRGIEVGGRGSGSITGMMVFTRLEAQLSYTSNLVCIFFLVESNLVCI